MKKKLSALLRDNKLPSVTTRRPFRDKQPCLIFYRARLRGGSRATASIEPLASLIRLSIMSSLEQRRRRCRLLVRRLVQPKLDGGRGLQRPTQRLVRRVIAAK